MNRVVPIFVSTLATAAVVSLGLGNVMTTRPHGAVRTGQQPTLVERVRWAYRNTRDRYYEWQIARALRRTEELMRGADVLLRGDGAKTFTRIRPAASDGKPVERSGRDAISSLLPPEAGCARNLAVVEIPATWPILPGSTNLALGEYVVEVSDELKRQGFRKVSFVALNWGHFWEVPQPSRREAEDMRRKLQPR